jgi:tetratricopeptide (TPR) repeat protein
VRGKELSRIPDLKVRFQELMALVNDYTVKGQYYDAVQTLSNAEVFAKDAAQKSSVKTSQGQLDAVGQEQLKKYQKCYDDKNYLDALKGFGLVQRTFGTLPCSLAARKAMETAEADTNVQTVLQEVKAQDLDDALDQIIDCPNCARGPTTAPASDNPSPPAAFFVKYAKVSRVEHIQKLPQDKQARAVSALEKMTKLYPLAATGILAAKDLKTLQDDTKFWTALKAYETVQQAQSLYNAAEMYRQMGMTAKAIEYYEQVTTKFPGSPLATKAKDAVAKMK